MVKKVFRTVSTIFLVILFLFVVVMFMMRIMGKTPSLFGYRVYYVATGSMEPTLNIGDVVMIKKTPAKEIHKGDIITFKSTDDALYGKPVTHRVVEEPEVKKGIYYYQTKGDADGATLDPVVAYNFVEGKYMFKIPLLGKIYSFFCKPYGLVTFVGIILLLFGYEMLALFFSNKKIDALGDDDDIFEPEKKSKKRKKE